MLLIGTLLAAAYADTWPGYVVAGFAVETRDDAPTDAELLIEATFAPIVGVVDGPNGAEPLESEMLVAPPAGDGLATIAPPPSGWEPNATYTVEAQPGHDDTGGPISFTFTTSDVGAETPSVPTIESVTATAWSEDTKYAWGCCKPTRLVTITVGSASTDPWAYVRLWGDFDGPSQITTEPVHGNLDVGIGPGFHDLTYVQWRDGETLEPDAFEVSQFSATGAASKSQRVEIDIDGNAAVGDTIDCCKDAADGGETDGSGCVSVPNAAALYAALAALAITRRRSRTR